MWGIQLVCAYIALLLMMRFFAAAGLYIFIVIMIVAANIEVLKVVQFSLMVHPIALGTIFFAAAFWAVDVLTEYYGAQVARKAILIGFMGSLLMLMCMILGLGFKPLSPAQIIKFHLSEAPQIQNSLLSIFNSTPALLLASLTSYLISQFTEVWIFKRIRQITGSKWLWFRGNVSTLLAAILDSIIFNILAWRILTTHPLPWPVLFYTYMLAAYVIRVLASVLGTPAVYLARYALTPEAKQAWRTRT